MRKLKELSGSILVRSIFSFVTVFAILCSSYSVAQAQTASPSNPFNFQKKAYKPDGTPWSGPVNVGDTIKYILTYDAKGTAFSGPVKIDDTLSPNQTYVAPTTAAPGWTWGATPYSTGNAETYLNSGLGPASGSVALSVPITVPPANNVGDGTIPIPILSLNKAFGVFHHASMQAEGQIDCWILDTLAKCGSPQPNAVSGFLRTPNSPHSIIRGTKIYFPGIRSDNTVTIGCFDGAGPAACADIPVPGATATAHSQIAGVLEDGSGNVYISVNDTIYCTSALNNWSTCLGWPPAGYDAATPSSGSGFYMQMEHSPNPTHLYMHVGNGYVQCVILAVPAPCAGWPAAGVNVGSWGNILSSLPKTGSTGDGGVCLWLGSNQTGCVSDTGTIISSTPTSVGTSMFSTFRLPGTGKVFFPNFSTNGPAFCFDYSGANGTACPGFPTATLANSSQYGFAVDPRHPDKCMLALGHFNLMWRFNYNTGEIGCEEKSATTPPVASLYCNPAPVDADFSWSNIKILTAGATGTLTVSKSGNPVSTIAITSGTTTYPVGTIGTGTGALTLTFTGTAGTATELQVEIEYNTGKPSEICYQTKVTSCGPVTNTAILGSASASGAGGTSVNQTVDLGVASGPSCQSSPPKPPVQNACFSGDSKVKCGKKPGTFVAIFEPKGAGGEVPDFVDVESLTTGVTLASSTGTYPVRNGKVRVTMIGANAGDTVKLSVNGSTLDPNSETGMSMCCNGEMEITIPKDLQCDGKKIDLAIVKTGETTPDPTQPFYAFELEVTNWGADINNGGNILVTDTVPAGMVFASAGGTDWQCDTLPANGGDEVKCAYTGNSFVVSGQILPKIKINATSTGHEPFPPVKNCAQVQPVPGAGLIDTKHSNDESCVTVSKPDEDVKVSIVKTCDKPVIDAVVIDNAAVDCVIKVTATGPVSTPITVVETLNMPGAGLSNVSTLPGSVGWGCGPTTNQGPVSCILPANTLTGPSYSAEIGATIQMDANPHLRPGKNCAVLEMGGNQIEETCAYVEVPEFGANQPTPKPAVTPVVGPVCDPATTVRRGKSCACLFSRMVQKSKTSCACVKGREFVKGKGCLRPKPQCRKGSTYNKERRRCEPICAKGQKYSSKRNKCFTPRPQCKAGTKYNAKRKKCLSVCRAGFTYSKRRKACVSICKRGSVYSRKRNKCITLKPKCRAGFAYSQKRKACVSVCKPGSRYDRRRKRCVSVGGGINIKICPKGTKFDIRKRRCVGKERPPPRPRHYNEADCEAAAVSPRECKAWLKQKNG